MRHAPCAYARRRDPRKSRVVVYEANPCNRLGWHSGSSELRTECRLTGVTRGPGRRRLRYAGGRAASRLMSPSDPESVPRVREAILGFAALIRSHPDVRAAFAGCGPLRIWWRVILALHGRPEVSTASPEAQAQVIAGGFAVYAWIFCGLGGVLALAIAGLALVPGVIGSRTFAAALVGGVTASIELWIAAGLLAAGARRLRTSHGDAGPRLVLGLILVMLFLSVALVAASVAVHAYTDVPVWMNMAALAVLLGLGVGSYGLELRYVIVALRGSPQA